MLREAGNEPEPFETRAHALRCLSRPAAAPSVAIAAAPGRFYRHPVTVSFRRLGLGRRAAPAGPEYIMRVVCRGGWVGGPEGGGGEGGRELRDVIRVN